MARTFSDEAIAALEDSVFATLASDTPRGKHYFKEAVAQELYKAWIGERGDTRIVEYCVPLICYHLGRNAKMLAAAIANKPYLENTDIFQTMVVNLIHALEIYNPDKGKIFSMLSRVIPFRLIDVAKETLWDKAKTFPLNEELEVPSHHASSEKTCELFDFISFLQQHQQQEGPTGVRITTAWLAAIADAAQASKGQAVIMQAICKASDLPDAIVRPYYLAVLTNYLSGDAAVA